MQFFCVVLGGGSNYSVQKTRELKRKKEIWEKKRDSAYVCSACLTTRLINTLCRAQTKFRLKYIAIYIYVHICAYVHTYVFLCIGALRLSMANGQRHAKASCDLWTPATASIIRHCTVKHLHSVFYVILAECCVIRLAIQSPISDKTKTNYENYKRETC